MTFFPTKKMLGVVSRELLMTIGGALLSIFVLLNVFVPQQQNILYSKPTSEDRGKHGFYALYKWLTDSGIRTLSLRKPVARIQSGELPASGNVMVINLPYTKQALESEWQSINQWIQQGNTAVVFVAGLYAKPEWLSSNDVFASIKKLTASEFSLNDKKLMVESNIEDSKSAGIDWQNTMDLFQSKRLQLSPTIKHSLFENIDALDSFYLPHLMQAQEIDEQNVDNKIMEKTYYALESESSRLGMGLLTISDKPTVGGTDDVLLDMHKHYVMWLLPVGDGWIYLSAFPDILNNRMLKKSQNASWFTQLLQLHLSSTGYVIFNDYPFGLSNLYDPDAFFSDRRLHYTFAFIASFWLLYALAFSPRLAPVVARPPLPENKNFIEVTAGFFSRRVQVSVVAKTLSKALIIDIQNRIQLRGKYFWYWMQDHPDISNDDVDVLKCAGGYVSGYKRGRVKLMQLTQTISRIYIVINRV
ncbi:hypothetical protein MNBD_GAMMA06-775 [hydrothermal vent metagenome]|uniref:DUF4350 domain-containing protein n=1 Tax=hydrothermal vent metagenome TaxID=652676 RepID=A0A3B0X8W6_9ZZZZ